MYSDKRQKKKDNLKKQTMDRTGEETSRNNDNESESERMSQTRSTEPNGHGLVDEKYKNKKNEHD